MPTGQMNVRIDDDIRIKGNAAFESIGWTPSQAARELWGYAAKNRRNRRKLQAMRTLLEEDDSTATVEHGGRAGSGIVADGLARMGIDVSACEPSDLSYEDLREAALYDRLEERGLL